MRLDHLLSKEKSLHYFSFEGLKKLLKRKCGGVAQLGEHLPCTQGAKSSSLFISTMELEKYIEKQRKIK